MTPLNEQEKREIIKLIEAGEALSEKWRGRLFPSKSGTAEIGKEYRLVYEGKARREEVLAQTPAAPWQLVRRFCEKQPHPDGQWRNLLVWGDNLLALRELLADQQGPNRFGTRGKIKLIYIDPPFATRQDFMKDKEKAYRDKVLGAQFIEFLRKRLILLREVMADDGSIYVHLDWKKGHYLKAALDEVFGEENFVCEVVWKRTSSHNDPQRYGNVHDTLFYYSKTSTRTWNPQYQTHDARYLQKVYVYHDERGRYRLGDLTAPGISGGVTGKSWRGVNPTDFGRHWRRPPDQLEELLQNGRWEFNRSMQHEPVVYPPGFYIPISFWAADSISAQSC